ncbi:hypothetical protein [Spongorhabdus nitratireducens]
MPKVPLGVTKALHALHLSGNKKAGKSSEVSDIKFLRFRKGRKFSPLKRLQAGVKRPTSKPIHKRKAVRSKPLQFLKDPLGLKARAEKKEFAKLESQLQEAKSTLNRLESEQAALPDKDKLLSQRKRARVNLALERNKLPRSRNQQRIQRLHRAFVQADNQVKRSSSLEGQIANARFAVNVLEQSYAAHPLAQRQQDISSALTSSITEDSEAELKEELEQLLSEDDVSSTDSTPPPPLNPDLDEDELIRQLEEWALSDRRK